MELSVFVVPYVHISILEHFCSSIVLDSRKELPSIMLGLRYLDCSIAMPFPLNPGPDILRPISFKLFADALFESSNPASIVDHVVLFAEELDDSVPVPLVVFEPA